MTAVAIVPCELDEPDDVVCSCCGGRSAVEDLIEDHCPVCAGEVEDDDE